MYSQSVQIVKDYFWAQADEAPIEARPPFKFVRKEDSDNEIPLSQHTYQSLFRGHPHGKGAKVDPRSILSMRI